MRFESAREAVIIAYGMTGIGQSFGMDGQDTGSSVISSVCPFCHKFGTCRELRKKEIVDDDPSRYRCVSCGERFKRPARRKIKGSINAKTTISRSSTDWRIINGVEEGWVQTVVERLPAVLESWLMYVYTDDHTADDEAIILGDVVQYLDKNGAPKLRGWGHASRAVNIVVMIIEDVRQQEMNGTRLYSKAQLAKAAGVDERQFRGRDHWGRIYDAVRQCLGELNRNALGPVDDMLQSIGRESV